MDARTGSVSPPTTSIRFAARELLLGPLAALAVEGVEVAAVDRVLDRGPQARVLGPVVEAEHEGTAELLHLLQVRHPEAVAVLERVLGVGVMDDQPRVAGDLAKRGKRRAIAIR